MYKKMLVPLDASEYAECTLEHVKELVAAHGVSDVVLLTVMEPPRSAAISYMGTDKLEELNKSAHESAIAYLEEAKARLALAADVKTAVVGALAADGILSYAGKNGVDVIVMSTHGRSGPSKWFIGSVAEKVLQRSPVPVFLIPSLSCRLTG